MHEEEWNPGARVLLLEEQLPVVVWATDRDLCVLWAMGGDLRARGLDPELLVGKTLGEIVHPADARDALEAHRRALEGESARYEIEMDGAVFDARVQPLRDRAGAIVGTAGAALDVTDRKEAERELQKSRRQLVEAQSVAHVGSWECDVENKTVTWSDELFRIYGLEPGQVTPAREAFLAMVHPDDRARVSARIDDAIHERAPYGEGEYRVRRPDGQERVLRSRGDILRSPRGTPARLVGATLDVTDRKRVEEELAGRARQQAAVATLGLSALRGADLQGLLDEAVALVAGTLRVECCKLTQLVDGDTLRLRAGVGWRPGLVGRFTVAVSEESLCGTSLRFGGALVVEDFATDGRFPRAPPLLRDHGIVSAASVLVGDRQRVFGVLAACSRHRRSYTQDDLNFLQSIANVLATTIERHHVEDELRDKHEHLRALSRRLLRAQEAERRAVARDLHDELGQLLTALKMDLRWLERRVGALEPPDRAGPMIDRAVEASSLVDQMVSTVQRLAADLRSGPLDELGLGSALRCEARRFQERTGVACEVRFAEGFPELRTDVATALYRIAQEALTNVARHAHASRVAVLLGADAAHLALRIEDDGRGIDEEASRTPGLGLVGMQERASMLGGQVTVARGSEGGTIVTTHVPLARAVAARREARP